MSNGQKRAILAVVVVVAGAAAVFSFFNSGMMGPKEEVVGSLPQLSKQQELEAAKAAEQSAPPADSAVRTGIDPADMEGNPKGKG